MILVDSSVWIEAGRRQGSLKVKVALETLLDEYEACWCGPVRLEVLGGARKEERGRLDFFFQAIPYRPMRDDAWEKAQRTAWRLRDRGHTLPWNDVLIATLALEWDMRVYAQDKHFEIMSREIGLRLYEPGYGGSFAPEE